MTLCSQCGTSLPVEAQFCFRCGTKVENFIISHSAQEKNKEFKINNVNLNPIGISYVNDVETIPSVKNKEEKEDENNSSFHVLKDDYSPTKVQLKKNKNQSEILSEKLQVYQDKLLESNWKNRSVMLRRIIDKWNFDLSTLLSEDKKLDEKIIEYIVLRNRPVCIVKDTDDSELAIDDKRKLKTLFRNIVQIERETGRKETFLGYPFLVGHILEDKYIRGPFVLFPISIEHRRDGKVPGWYIVFSKEKKPILNRALMEAIKKASTIVFPESLTEDLDNMLENFSNLKTLESIIVSDNIDIKKNNRIESLFLNELLKILIDNKCPIELNDDSNLLKTQTLDSISVKEQEKIEKQNLHLVNFKIIGNFPQGDISIYKDYEELINRVKKNGESDLGIINNLLEAPFQEDVWKDDVDEKRTDIELDDIKPDQLNLVLESDSSQDSVIVDSEELECTVVRGPPGTGKSQAIANIAANAISKGKNVLVVCQKRAALDVVYQRLDRIGLGKYSAVINDHSSDRINLYKKLSSVIESKSNLISHDNTIKRLPIISNEMEEIIHKQKNILSALQKQYFDGINSHTLYSIAKRDYIKKLDLSKIIKEIDFNSLSQIAYIIGTFERNVKTFDTNINPLYQRKNFAEINFNNMESIYLFLDNLIELLKDLKVFICSNEKEQQELINSLNVLLSEKGFLKKLKPSWIQSINFVKKILKIDNNNFLENHDLIEEYHVMAQKGKNMWNLISKFADFLTDDGFKEIKKTFILGDFAKLGNTLIIMRESLKKDFEEIYTFDKKKSELTSLLRAIFEECSKKLKDENEWEQLLKQEVYHHWIEYIEKDNHYLKTMPFETYQQNRKRLEGLLFEQRTLTRLKIIHGIENEIVRPEKNSRSRSKKDNKSKESLPWFKIADDLNKKRRLPPVRKLLETYQNIVFKLAPCWLASPQAVSAIFKLQRNMFDLIIFDEASQSAVEKSIPVLYRGKKIVIMGDEKQLRPFDLFVTKNNDEEEELEDLIDDSMMSESLLMLSKRIYGYRYLNWHYRSKYQELIDFSNHSFYGGNLQVAPNIIKKHIDAPIRWIACSSGIWEDRKNFPESILVVNEIKNILLNNKKINKKTSIGVITFNDSQKTIILDEIDNRRKTDIEFDDLYTEAENPDKYSLEEMPFVKNIENVQGDERDSIIFSVGYAKDPNGKLSTKFGTLNQVGGENRLNVAITRAREEIIIICSFDPDHLKTEGTKNDGPKKLKEYLQYAKAISEKNIEDVYNILSSYGTTNLPINSFDNENNGSTTTKVISDLPSSNEGTFEESVSNKLKLLGYDVDSKVGNSGSQIDLAVVHPDNPSKYLLAIECDGHAFHSAKSVKERDVIRPQFLESRGWIVERTWSINWWKDPEKEINRLQKRIEELRKR